MSRVELIYHYKGQPTTMPLSIEGNLFIMGIGKCRIVSNNDPEKTISFSMISSLIEPRNTRLMAKLKPGQEFRIVRPTATLSVNNTEPLI